MREFAFYGFLPREKKTLREKLQQIAAGVRVAVIHESPFRIIDLTEAVAEILPQAHMTVCCDLTKIHEKTISGWPDTVLAALKTNEKTEKGEYCVVLDLQDVPAAESAQEENAVSMEARLTEIMKQQGKTLREAQEALLEAGEKKNAVKQAAIQLKKWFAEA